MAGVAQSVEQLICNQRVGGSNPFASSMGWIRVAVLNRYAPGSARWVSAGRYPSGQRGQTVNLLAYAFGGSNPPLPTTSHPTIISIYPYLEMTCVQGPRNEAAPLRRIFGPDVHNVDWGAGIAQW